VNYLPVAKTTIELTGGLGNQLFQLIAGQVAAENLGTRLVIDKSPINSSSSHINSGIETLDFSFNFSIYYLSGYKQVIWRLTKALSRRFLLINRIALIAGFVIDYDVNGKLDTEKKQRTSKKTFGYFQNQDYVETFLARGHYIRLKTESDWYLRLLKRIQAEDLIVAHYRLGDYLDPRNPQGPLPATYYKNAYSSLAGKSNPKLLVFSDDPEEAQKRLSDHFVPTKIEFIIPPENDNPSETLILLANAKKLILGNSSFSLIAALLGSKKEAAIPTPFYQQIKFDVSQFPESWKRIENSFG
jgi:hypothetical protein